MGRKYIYFCDGCGKSFGTKTHINIKGGNIFISHYLKPNDKLEKVWTSHKISIPCDEYHFCNVECMGVWLDKIITPRLKEVGKFQNK